MSELIHPELVAALEVLAAEMPGARISFSLHHVPVASFEECDGVSVIRTGDGRMILTGSETHGGLTVRFYSVDLPRSAPEQAA